MRRLIVGTLRVLVWSAAWIALAGVSQCPPTTPSFVLLGADTRGASPQPSQVTVGAQSFVADGNVGVNEFAGSSVNFGASVFMPQGSSVWADSCTPASGLSLFDLWYVNAANGCASSAPVSYVRTADQDPDPANIAPGAIIRLSSVPKPLFDPAAATSALPTYGSFDTVSCSPTPGCVAQNPRSTGTGVPSAACCVLSPGSWLDVTVPQKGELDLCDEAAGTYFLRSLHVQKFGRVRVGHAGCIINIQAPQAASTSFVVDEFGTFGPYPGSTIKPSDIQVNCGDEGTNLSCQSVKFAQASHVALTLYAPNATLYLGEAMRAEGRYVANIIKGDHNVLLRSAAGPRMALPEHPQFATLRQEDYGVDADADPASVNAPGGIVDMNQSLLFPLTIGAPGIRSLTLTTAGGPTALGCFLPATSQNPAALCATPNGNNNCSIPGDEKTKQYMEITSCGDALDSNTKDGTVTCPTLPPATTPDPHCSGGQGAGTLAGQVVAAKLNVLMSEFTNLLKPPTNVAQPPPFPLPGLGDFVIPSCICTDSDFDNSNDQPGTPSCSDGRFVDLTNQLQQGPFAGLEDGLTTVNGLIAFADSALASDCNGNGICTNTCGTAFAPDDPVRIGEMEWALQAINECFSGRSQVDHTSAPRLLDATNCNGLPTCCSKCGKSFGQTLSTSLACPD